MERGQVLLLVTFAIVGLVAIVGLALDVGVIFIANARLRRAVDAAVLAAAQQYREGYEPAELEAAAVEFLALNGVEDPGATLEVCDDDYPAYHSSELCTTPARKLVRIHASAQAHLVFLTVIGINRVSISATAVSEAASVDVVLVIDTSESMTWAAKDPDEIAAGLDPDLLDPHVCNDDTLAAAVVDDPSSLADGMPGECHPFEEVKRAAYDFIDELFFPYDRVAVVTFDKFAEVPLEFSSDQSEIQDAIRDLAVYEGDEDYEDPICPVGLPCRLYDADGKFLIFDCPIYYSSGDPEYCTSTNIGAGLAEAGLRFTTPPVRQESLWAVIILGDGAANGGACPPSTWSDPPFCRDHSVSSRHQPMSHPDYDADDYARDMADYVGEGGQNALILAIGLGPLVRVPDTGIPDDPGAPEDHDPAEDEDWVGERFFEYAVEPNRGNGLYFFAPSGDDLRAIFKKIAERLATRLTE
jgi:hypothetical protein